MGMDPWLLAGTAVVLFLGGVLQGAIGFAFALFVAPILVWLGMPLPETVVIVAAGSATQSLLGSWDLRRELPGREAAWAIAGRLPAMLAGTLLLTRIDRFGLEQVRLLLGILICLIVGVQIACKVKPVDRLHWGWGVTAFLSSGLLAGISGMGGPPLVMWVMAHNWSGLKTRAFLFAVFMASFPLQLILLYWAFGGRILQALLTILLMAPAVFLGSRIGIPLGNRLPKPLLRTLAYVALMLIGLSAIAPSLFRLLAP